MRIMDMGVPDHGRELKTAFDTPKLLQTLVLAHVVPLDCIREPQDIGGAEDRQNPDFDFEWRFLLML